MGAILDRIADRPKTFVLDFSAVPFLDSTAANTIEDMARKANRSGGKLYITGASPSVRRFLLTHGVRPPIARYQSSIDNALAALHIKHKAKEG